jgi:hypothetical protein
MDVYRVMELMLEIKRCNYFKEMDRAKLNYVELRCWIWFSLFVGLFSEDTLHPGKE